MGALAAVGASTASLRRADSVTNEVWLTPEYVVRVNRDASLRLHREAVLSQVLPEAVGYPPLVMHGGEVGGDWLVTHRLPGVPLSRAWPTMATAQRRQAVHATPCPRLDGLHDVPHLLDPAATGRAATARLLTALGRAGQLDLVDAALMDDAAAMVRATADALDPFDATTIVHGDLTFENILWDEDHVTALLDFEYARPGPPDLDLDVLLRFVAMPHLHVAADYEGLTRAADYADVPWWFAEDYPALFAHPRQIERMRIFALAWNVRELLAFPPSEPLPRLHHDHAYQRLVRLLRGTSYLDRMNGASVLDF